MNTETQTQVAEQAVKSPPSIKSLLAQEGIQNRFKEILGQKAPGFVSSILNVVNGNTMFKNVDPNSVILSAAVAATLDLPINPNLGFAYIIPYKDKAQFQMGYKGYIQLAMRTGQYKNINAIEVRSGQLVAFDTLREDFQFDFTKTGGEVIGYVAYFKLLNGFEKTVYWNVGQIIEHAKRYSKSYGKQSSPWTTNFPEMAMKTLLKHVLSKYGILSIDMQKAIAVDQGIIKNEDATVVDFPDSNGHETENQEAEVVESTTNETVVETEQTGSGAGEPAANGNKNIPKL